MKFVNCTPHVLNIVCVDGSIREIAPSGVCPRCKTARSSVDTIDGVEISETLYGDVEDAPPYEYGTIYVVSRIVLDALGRDDMLSPGELVRDAQGRVIGCKGLSR
jgi:hypothetical protein